MFLRFGSDGGFFLLLQFCFLVLLKTSAPVAVLQIDVPAFWFGWRIFLLLQFFILLKTVAVLQIG
jgi:hypothetical protein